MGRIARAIYSSKRRLGVIAFKRFKRQATPTAVAVHPIQPKQKEEKQEVDKPEVVVLIPAVEIEPVVPIEPPLAIIEEPPPPASISWWKMMLESSVLGDRKPQVEQARLMLLEAEARLQSLKKNAKELALVMGKEDLLRKQQLLLGFIGGVLFFQLLLLLFRS